MYFPIFVLFIVWSYHLFSADEDPLARRLQAHLTIKDYSLAITEAEKALLLYPSSPALHENYIRALAKAGDEKKLLLAWDVYTKQFPDKVMNRELIEEMAWGILNKASHSSSIIMREMALLAAFFSQEAKGVTILFHGMQDANYAVRTIAVKLASQFRDQKLISEVIRLFKQEKVWTVRKQVLEAVGEMKIDSMKNDLEGLIASEESLPGEKALAISSLLNILENISRIDIERLSSSNRAGLRLLASQAIAHFQSIRDVDQLFALAKDHHPDVRLQAYQALGQIRPTEQVDEILKLARLGAQDFNYQVALSAIWLLSLYSPEEGLKLFDRFFKDGRQEVKSLAAASLAATGQYGLPLALQQFRAHNDPYVRLNLALGLIGQREATEEASIYVRQMVINDKEKWQFFKVGLFSAIINKRLKISDDSIDTAETDDGLIRLELLNLLAILKTPDIHQAIRKYLLERSWEISATASALLLTEGDDSAIELVQQLLQDSNSRVRLQAAMILSLWSRDESAIQILEECYPTSDWELKAKILEGLGRIGSIRSVPFLINVLKEPSQTLRLISAMALIQSLNH